MGSTGRIPVTETEPLVAVTLAFTMSVVRLVVTEKFTLLLPAGMVTLAGTFTRAESDLRLQVMATAAV